MSQQIYANTSNMVGSDNFMASITDTSTLNVVVTINTLNSAHWW